MDLKARVVDGKRIWYVTAHYFDGTKRRSARRSTGVRDDGTAKTKRTAEIIGRDIEQSLAAGKNRVARPTTVQQAIDALIEQMETASRAQPTIDIVIEKSAHLFAFFGATTPIETVTDQQMADYAKARKRAPVYVNGAPDGRTIPGRTVSALTIERELRTLRQAAKAVGSKPPAMPDLGITYKPRERFLDHAETLRLLASVVPSRKDHVVMYRLTGVRASELYRITPADVDLERNEVRVRGTKTKGADRVIPMANEVREILERRRHRVPMFEPWSEGSCTRDLKLAAARAGIEPLSLNDLRRSFATELAAKGVPALHLARLLGHGSTRMVERVYARVGTGSHMHEAIGKLSTLRRGSQKGRKRA